MNLSPNNDRQRQRWSLCLSIAINTVILAVALIFSNMEFGTNDDRDISNLLADVNGTGCGYYITFVNIILCRALSFLYQITNNITNWYVLLSVVLSYLSLVSIGYLLIYRSPNLLLGSALCLITSGLLYESHYITFQFTHNAALISLAGILSLTDVTLHGCEKGSLLQSLLGILLTLFGSMIRFQSIYFTLPYLIMFIGYELVFLKKEEGFMLWIRCRWKALVSISVCIVLVFAARGVHNYVYQSDPMLKEFYEVNLLRAELLDYGFPSYEENVEEIQSLGLTEEDFTMFSKQSFLDQDVFSREVLEALVEMKSEQSSSYSLLNLKLSSVLDVLRTVKADMKENLFWQLLGVAFLIFLLCSKHRRWLVALGCGAAPLAMMWYFISVSRMPYRIWYSIIAPAVVSMVYLSAVSFRPIHGKFSRVKFHISEFLANTAITLMCIAILFSVVSRLIEDDSVKITDTYENVLALADQYPDTMILLDRPTISGLTYNSTITPMTCLARGSHDNICYQGGWICWTPGNLSVLSNFNTDNIYRSIGEGLEVILVDARTPELKLSFIQRHYNPSVSTELIGVIDGINVYRLYIP